MIPSPIAPPTCTPRAPHQLTSNHLPSLWCSTNIHCKNYNTISYPAETSPNTQMESTNTATRSSMRSGTAGTTTPLQLMDMYIMKENGWNWTLHCYCRHASHLMILLNNLKSYLLFIYITIRWIKCPVLSCPDFFNIVGDLQAIVISVWSSSKSWTFHKGTLILNLIGYFVGS